MALLSLSPLLYNDGSTSQRSSCEVHDNNKTATHVFLWFQPTGQQLYRAAAISLDYARHQGTPRSDKKSRPAHPEPSFFHEAGLLGFITAHWASQIPFSFPGLPCLQVSYIEESLLSHPSAPGAGPPFLPRPEVYLTLSLREHSSWMTSWRRQPCQTGLPNRSQAPLLWLLTLGASSSAHEGEGHSPWIQPNPARTSSSPPGSPCSSLAYLTFPQQSPQSPT